MRIWTMASLFLVAGTMFQPATASAQSIWQKVKQAAKQAEKDAQTKQNHAAQPARTDTSSTSTGHAQPAVVDAVDVSSPAIKTLYRQLDVGGVALGMTAREAQTAIQSRNRALVPSSTPFGFTDLPTTSFVSQVQYQVPGSVDEIQDLYLTLQPMQPEVLSIRRYTRYNEHNVPTVANTLAALRAKYGPETTSKIQTSGGETILYWIFDGAGRLVPKNRAENPNQDLVGWCASGELQLDVKSGLHSGGFPYQKFCAPLTVVRAELHEWEQTRKNSHGQSLPPGMLFQMDVTASSYPLLKKSVDATLNMLVAARDARQQKEKKAASQNVPTL